MTATGVFPGAVPLFGQSGVSGGITRDAFLGGRLQLCQPISGYRAGMDAVMLAAAAPALTGGVVLDAGAGVGAVGLCYLSRVGGPEMTFLELQEPLVALAARNIDDNGFAARARAVAGDIRHSLSGAPGGGFDLVMSNPPWLEASHADPPQDSGRHLAHVETTVSLSVWLDRCLRFLKPRGWLAVIHRADRLDAALAALAGRAGEITVVPLWPRANTAAARVILLARKGVRGPCRMVPGLVLHEADGACTPAAAAILRDGTALATDS